MFVGWLTLVVAPPLALLGMTVPMYVGPVTDVSLITPLLVAGYLVTIVGYGLFGTLIALLATLGTPVVVTGAVGVGIGYLRRRSARSGVASPDGLAD
jgi:hypothetical protein